MALVVETGTGSADSTSYISVSFADSYHRARNNTAWASLAFQVKEASILKATEFIDAEYIFLGEISFPETPQALAWPRAGVVTDDCVLLDSDALPVALQRATAELALALAANTDGGAFPTTVQGNVLRRRERVGVIESETEGTIDVSVRFYPRVHQLLASLIIGRRSGGANSPIMRG